MTVFAPYVPSYTASTPYITTAEYMASPTGVNVSQLVPRGTQDENMDALATMISRGSSFVDQICNQVLCATIDVHSGKYRIQSGGIIQVPVTFSPIVAVNSVKVGTSPSSMAPITNMQDVWIDRKVVTFPINTVQLLPTYTSSTSNMRPYVEVEYVNGWANTVTSSDSVAGADYVVVDAPIAMNIGMQLYFSDPGKSEDVIVENIVDNKVYFTKPLQFDHNKGTSLSALPHAVKQAAILCTSALIKTRGSEATVMASMGAPRPTKTASSEDGGMQEVAIARQLLKQFIRTV